MAFLATIGYEGASIEDFIGTLKTAGITAVLDVREVAISRKRGFAKLALSRALEGAGIAYVHLKGLGDPKAGREAARGGDWPKFLRIYKAHFKSDAARADFKKALELASAGSACLLCYERNHMVCHRKLVADAISSKLAMVVRHLGVRAGIADGPRGWSRESPDLSQGAPARW